MSKIKVFALGGLNEIGKNMYVVNVDGDIFVFDAGLKFADDKMLGVDYIIPNYDYLKENESKIKGIFITHAHEEQKGAILDAVNDLKNVKIYGAEFTIESLKQEFICEKVDTNNLVVINAHRKINFGKNAIFPVRLTHSVPDAVGYVLYTEDGAIVYTGNYVFDPAMTGSYKTDIGKLGFIGKQGVLCLLGESLYADKVGYTSPHHRVREVFRDILSRTEGRILFNIYTAQLYRIEELFKELSKTDHKVVIMGKNLQDIVLSQIDNKRIDFDKSRIGSIHHINDKNTVIIISDEREKPYSNLRRIIKGYDKFIKITDEDTVVIASQVYDGMEKSSTALFDMIAKLGINLIILPTNKYLSMHASQEDVMLMLDLINPKYYFPVIGEYRHQVANKEVALKVGMREEDILLKLNGEVVCFENGILVDTNEKVKADDILIDGKTIGDIGEIVIKEREALSDNGIVIIIVTIEKETKKVLAGPEIISRGFIYVKDNIDLIKEVQRISLEVIKENTKFNYIDYSKARFNIRDKVGRYLYEQTECKPMIMLVADEI